MKKNIPSLACITTVVIFSLVLISGCSSTTEPEEGYYPVNLNIVKEANSRVKLTWDFTYSYQDTVYYQIQHTEGYSFGSLEYIYAEVEYGQNWFVDYIPTNDNTPYAYRVRAKNISTGETSTWSEVVAYLSEFTYPTDMIITQISQDYLNVSWNDNCSGEQGYNVDKKTDNGDWENEYLFLAGNVNTFNDYVSIFENVTYRVYAYVGVSKTDYLIDTLFVTLMTPTELSATALDQNKIRLSWTDNSDGEDGFYIDKQIGELPWDVNYAQVNENDTTYVDDITIDCATINYRVRAYNDSYESPDSDVASINVLLNLIGEYNTSGTPLHVYLPVNHNTIPEWTAFISENYQGLSKVNCMNPTSPSLVDNYQAWADRTLSSFIYGNFAYIATQSQITSVGGIQKYDLDTGAVFYSETNGIPKDIFVDGDFAYVAEGNAGLSILYLGGMQPALFSNSPLYDARSIDIILIDGVIYAYVANGLNQGMAVFDVTDPANPTQIADYPINGVGNDIEIKNSYVYLANGEEGLEIIDVTDPQNPISVQNIYTGGFVNGVSAESDKVYISDMENGIFVIDTQIPENAYILGNLALDTQPSTIQLAGSYVYITDNYNLKIIQVKP